MFLEEQITPEICDEIMPLLQMHYDELSHPEFKDIQVLKPRFDKYIEAGNKRMAVLFTIREVSDDDVPVEGKWKGPLKGYWVFFINDTLHYEGTVQAAGDVLFVVPEYRGIVAWKFAKECIEHLKNGGVQIIHAYCKQAHDLTRFYEGLGMKQIDLHFSMRLN